MLWTTQNSNNINNELDFVLSVHFIFKSQLKTYFRSISEREINEPVENVPAVLWLVVMCWQQRGLETDSLIIIEGARKYVKTVITTWTKYERKTTSLTDKILQFWQRKRAIYNNNNNNGDGDNDKGDVKRNWVSKWSTRLFEYQKGLLKCARAVQAPKSTSRLRWSHDLSSLSVLFVFKAELDSNHFNNEVFPCMTHEKLLFASVVFRVSHKER